MSEKYIDPSQRALIRLRSRQPVSAALPKTSLLEGLQIGHLQNQPISGAEIEKLNAEIGSLIEHLRSHQTPKQD